jgi:hypothetical protein
MKGLLQNRGRDSARWLPESPSGDDFNGLSASGPRTCPRGAPRILRHRPYHPYQALSQICG